MAYEPLYLAQQTSLGIAKNVVIITSYSNHDYITCKVTEAQYTAIVSLLQPDDITKLLRDLLYNPQIRYLLLLSRSSVIVNNLYDFFAKGFKPDVQQEPVWLINNPNPIAIAKLNYNYLQTMRTVGIIARWSHPFYLHLDLAECTKKMAYREPILI